jgi:hypothetical protein
VAGTDANSKGPSSDPPTLRCDTCGRATAVVSRVVIDEGYDRSNARPLWNCPECYAEKEQRRREGERR